MNREEFIQTFKDVDSKWEGDNAYQGLQILSKYTDNLVQGAGKDVIYSEDVDKLLEEGITKEDVEKLAMLNWMVENGKYLACFV